MPWNGRGGARVGLSREPPDLRQCVLAPSVLGLAPRLAGAFVRASLLRQRECARAEGYE